MAIIVDDEALARSELRFFLGELNQAEVVSEAASVREAIEKLKEYPCDVMFLDINMPEATGLQLAEALQHLKFPPASCSSLPTASLHLMHSRSTPSTIWSNPSKLSVWLMRLARVREHVVLHGTQHKKPSSIPVEKAGKKNPHQYRSDPLCHGA